MGRGSGMGGLLAILGLAYLFTRRNGEPGYYVPYNGWRGARIELVSEGLTATPEEIEESKTLTRRTRIVTTRERRFVIPMTKYRPGSEDLIVDPGIKSPIPGNIQAMLAYGIEA